MNIWEGGFLRKPPPGWRRPRIFACYDGSLAATCCSWFGSPRSVRLLRWFIETSSPLLKHEIGYCWLLLPSARNLLGMSPKRQIPRAITFSILFYPFLIIALFQNSSSKFLKPDTVLIFSEVTECSADRRQQASHSTYCEQKCIELDLQWLDGFPRHMVELGWVSSTHGMTSLGFLGHLDLQFAGLQRSSVTLDLRGCALSCASASAMQRRVWCFPTSAVRVPEFLSRCFFFPAKLDKPLPTASFKPLRKNAWHEIPGTGSMQWAGTAPYMATASIQCLQPRWAVMPRHALCD